VSDRPSDLKRLARNFGEVEETLLGTGAAQRLDAASRAELALICRRQFDAVREVVRRVDASVAQYVPDRSESATFARDLAERVGRIRASSIPTPCGPGDPLDLLAEAKLRGDGRRPLNEALWSMIGDGYLEGDVVRLAASVLHRSASRIRYRIAEHAKLVSAPCRKRE
jgi:hypothetical protein